MEIGLNESISEVLDVLNHTDENIVNKISSKFMNFLENNKAQNYQVRINYTENDWKEKLNDKTKAILALIYRDYVAEKDEREMLIKNERAEIERKQQEKKEKYSYNNLFKSSDRRTENEKLREEAMRETEQALTVIQEQKWYERIIDRIKDFFRMRR